MLCIARAGTCFTHTPWLEDMLSALKEKRTLVLVDEYDELGAPIGKFYLTIPSWTAFQHFIIHVLRPACFSVMQGSFSMWVI